MQKEDRSNWRDALARTRKVTFGRLATLFGATEITPQFWDELEAALIQADMGINLVDALLHDLQDSCAQQGITRSDEAKILLKSMLMDRLTDLHQEVKIRHAPEIIILIGVNGSGKTTAAARLAYRFKSAGKSVLFAAADTYRAAASEQLQQWGARLGIDVISGQAGSDPGAIVYDATQAAIARSSDVVIVDTSGRMHTQHNLMAELQKVCRVSAKVLDGAPHQVLLVLDGTTGQNGLAQAQAFINTVEVTGVILAKLDTSAKGGVGIAIADQLHLPIVYVGLGEQEDDFAAFDPEAYVDGLIGA